MALENVQNRFFGLKTVKVVLKQVFEWEKGQISPLPLETQLTYLNRELLPISLNKDWLGQGQAEWSHFEIKSSEMTQIS